MVEVLHLPHPKLLGLLRGGEHFSAQSRHGHGQDQPQSCQPRPTSQRHAARITHSTSRSTSQTLRAAAAACRSSMSAPYARSCLLLDPWRSHPRCPHAMRQPDPAPPRPLGTLQSRPHAAIRRSQPDREHSSARARGALEARTLHIHDAHVFVMEIECGLLLEWGSSRCGTTAFVFVLLGNACSLKPICAAEAAWPATGMTHRNSPGVVIGHRRFVAKLDWLRQIWTCA